MRQETERAGFHQLECRQAARIIWEQEKLGLTVIIGRTQIAIHRGADMARLFGFNGAMAVGIADHFPFLVPALLVTCNDARSRQKHFGDRTATFLRFAKTPPELVGKPRTFRPMMPAIRLVMRILVGGDLFDRCIATGYIDHPVSPLSRCGSLFIASFFQAYSTSIEE